MTSARNGPFKDMLRMLLRIAEDHLGKVLEVLNLVLGDCHSFLSGVAFGHEGCGAGLLILSGSSLGWPPSRYECAPALTG